MNQLTLSPRHRLRALVLALAMLAVLGVGGDRGAGGELHGARRFLRRRAADPEPGAAARLSQVEQQLRRTWRPRASA